MANKQKCRDKYTGTDRTFRLWSSNKWENRQWEDNGRIDSIVYS